MKQNNIIIDTINEIKDLGLRYAMLEDRIKNLVNQDQTLHSELNNFYRFELNKIQNKCVHPLWLNDLPSRLEDKKLIFSCKCLACDLTLETTNKNYYVYGAKKMPGSDLFRQYGGPVLRCPDRLDPVKYAHDAKIMFEQFMTVNSDNKTPDHLLAENFVYEFNFRPITERDRKVFKPVTDNRPNIIQMLELMHDELPPVFEDENLNKIFNVCNVKDIPVLPELRSSLGIAKSKVKKYLKR